MKYFLAERDTGRFLAEIEIGAGFECAMKELLISRPPNTNLDYYLLGKWITPPQQPSPYHTFNYHTKQWADLRAIDEVKCQKWSEIKSLRDAFEFGGFEYKGNIYDSDLTSQNRIMGASIAGLPQTWTLKDNSMVDLSAQQLNEMYASLQAHIAQSHERGRIARQLIYEAETKEQIELITF